MTKESGLGAGLYVGGNDLSGDVGSLSRIASPRGVTDVTPIDKSAFERLLLLKDGGIDFSTWFNPAALAAHPTLASLPRTDTQVTYRHGSAIGNVACSMVAKQISYDGNRAQDGSFPLSVASVANGYGLEWGRQLTAGLRTDTAATNGTSFDQTDVTTSFGWQAYAHVTSVTGTSVTLTIEDSANNSAFTALTGGAFTAVLGGATGFQRLAGGSTATVRRYVRVVSSGTFNPASFIVVFVRNMAAVAF